MTTNQKNQLLSKMGLREWAHDESIPEFRTPFDRDACEDGRMDAIRRLKKTFPTGNTRATEGRNDNWIETGKNSTGTRLIRKPRCSGALGE